jgi:hypothetical protein
VPKALFGYFESVLPNYDKERVKQSDVRKIIKWFVFLNQRGLLTTDPKDAEEKITEEVQ